jgi:CRISPR/Cas system-associated exonuclease Cas4 (RecB family)
VTHAYSAARLHQVAMEFLRAQKGPVLVLAPARAAADDLIRETCEAGQGFLGIQRLTLTQLAASLAAPRLAELALKPASRLAIEALTTRVIAAAEGDHDIPYFSPVAGTPGLGPAVAATLTELRLAGVDVAELAASGAPGRDLAALWKSFEDDRAEEGLADLAVVFDLAVEVLDQDLQHESLGIPLLILDVPLPTKAHRELLRRVAARATDVLALGLTGDEAGLRVLSELVGAPAVAAGGVLSPFDRVAESLFAASAEAQDDAPLEFFSAAGEGLECIEIARRLRRMASKGMAFDRAAVLLRSPERYQSLLEEALRRAGIPAWFSRGVARPDPAGRAFLALLACAQEKCSATRFAEYLSLGQVPAVGEPVSAVGPVAPDDELLASFFVGSAGGAAAAPEADRSSTYVVAPLYWERLIVDAAVVGGRARWERRLQGLERELELQRATLERENSPRAEHVTQQILRLRSLAGFALPLIAELDSLPGEALWGEWLDRLTDLARTALKHPESVGAVLDELRAMESIGPVELNEVYLALAERLRFLRRDSGQSRYGRVFVGGIAEARGRAYDVVFLPGLAEGLFPRRPLEDPILLDEYRAAIGGLPMQDDRVSDERLLLRMAVGAARKRLVYSYPRMDVMQNRPRVPSFYALELLRAARGKLPDLRLFEREAAEAAPTRLDWPAPRNPIDAIDDAEFDLSMLGHIQQLPAEEAKGSAHYLVEANSHLVRALRNRARRWRPGWFPVDGLVKPRPETLVQLEQFRLTSKAYSPSSLQQYADCPYKFFLYAVQRLEPREAPAALEQMDPLTRGSLFHETQRVLMEELKAKGLLPVTQARLKDALLALDAALDRMAAAFAEDLAPAIDRVWTSEVEELRTDFRGWLQHVAMHGGMWVPEFFELEFKGVPILDGYLVRGKIDVVERHLSSGAVRITDHKTGSFPDKPPVFVGGGKTLQPILYSLAARAELSATVESGRLYFCTRKGKYQDVDIRMTPDAEERLSTVLRTIDEAIGGGFLPAAPAVGMCEYCNYSMVCGPYEELRVGRKTRAELEPLVQLRRLP